MPFDQVTPRSFTPVSVRTNAPIGSGVYGISNAREWIFIGETDNIQASLLRDLQQEDSALHKRRPTGFVFELCDRAARVGRQERLVLEYGPVCNRQSSGSETGAIR